MKYSLPLLVALLAACPAQAQMPEANDSTAVKLKDLPEAMVKGSNPVARLEKGALTFNMPRLLKQLPSDNAYEALGKIPGVQADDNGLSYANQPLTLIIDGKPTTLNAEQVIDRLKQLPADQLAKAEIMLSAPARYHVRGAVINVVTKDYTGQVHTSGQVSNEYTQSRYANDAVRANLIHTHRNVTFDANYSYDYGKDYGEIAHTAEHPLATGTQHYADLTQTRNKYIIHSYRASMEWQIAKEHELSLAYSGQWLSDRLECDAWGTDHSYTYTPSHNKWHNADLNYRLPFGLNIVGSYMHYEAPQTQTLEGSIGGEVRDLVSHSNQVIDKWLVSVDQSHKLPKDWTIDYGAKGQFTRNNNTQRTTDASGNVVDNATSALCIDERIVSLYAGFSKQVCKSLFLQMQAEVENFHTPVWNKWSVYPGMNISWQASPKHMLNLAFSSESKFPSYWATMNTVQYASAYDEVHGSPNLKPSKDYDLSVTWSFLQKYSLTAMASFCKDYFSQLPYQPSDRMVLVLSQQNWNFTRQYVLNASAQYRIGSWLKGNAYAGVCYSHDKCDAFYDIPFNRHKIWGYAGTVANVAFTKSLSLQIRPTFQSGGLSGTVDVKPFFMLHSSLRWTSPKGHWVLRADGYNLTNTKMVTESKYANQNYRMDLHQSWIRGSLTVIYKFGGYKERQTKAVDTSRMGH